MTPAGRFCVSCEDWKPIECYRIRIHATGWNVMGVCRDCQREQSIAYYHERKHDALYIGAKRQRDQHYYEQNTDQVLARMKDYHRRRCVVKDAT